MMISPAALADSKAQRQPSCGNGPMVCVVVMSLPMTRSSQSERCRATTAQHDVEHVAEHLVADRLVHREARAQALARRGVGDALVDRVELEQRVVREIHLRDE